ncbi:hypothetical protein ACWDKQ_14225 [Saccharopolyspora sp. NPDC000995]
MSAADAGGTENFRPGVGLRVVAAAPAPWSTISRNGRNVGESGDINAAYLRHTDNISNVADDFAGRF